MSADQQQLLSRLLENTGIVYEEFMREYGSQALPAWKIDELCNRMNDEFLLHGLLESGAPNEYGHRLEALLDEVNRQRLYANGT